MKRLLLFNILMVLILPGFGAADSIWSPETSHGRDSSKVVKGRSKKAAPQKKKEQAKKAKRAASDSEESLQDDIVMEHPFDMRSMKEGHIEIVKNNLQDFFQYNKQNVEDLKVATTRAEKLIIFERIRQSNACLMQRYRHNLKKLREDFNSMLGFLFSKLDSKEQEDKLFVLSAQHVFGKINSFKRVLNAYSFL